MYYANLYKKKRQFVNENMCLKLTGRKKTHYGRKRKYRRAYNIT